MNEINRIEYDIRTTLYIPKLVHKDELHTKRNNFKYLILKMLIENDAVKWSDFKEELNISYSSLSVHLHSFLNKNYIERVQRGVYKITFKGKKKFIKSSISEDFEWKLIYRGILFPPKYISESTNYEDIILWMFYNNEYLEMLDFFLKNSPLKLSYSSLSEFFNLLLKNGFIVKDEGKRFKITQEGKVEYLKIEIIDITQN